jgi:HEAT repeat protein
VPRTFARTLLGGAAVVTLGLGGCAGTYDLITSERFKERPFHTLFTTEDPIVVLETVQEGDDRVRAMGNLKEPRRNGGSSADQDKVIAILQASATTDKRALCRLAAVQALARFDDPRVGPILMASYRNAPYDAPPAGNPNDPTITPAAGGALSGIKTALANFTPETITNLQSQSLEALGRHRSQDALNLLVQVAITPTESKTKGPVEPAGAILSLEASVGTNESDRIDVRLAAIRALSRYENDPNAIRALVTVLRTDKDVAVRGRAHESLVKITGQDLPPDGQAWTEWMERSGKR